MKQEKFILIDINDDSGNDNGVLDRKQMTEQEAYDLNNKRELEGSNCRWIMIRESKTYVPGSSPSSMLY